MPLTSDEDEKLQRSPTALRRFGFTVGMALVLLGGFLAWRQREVGWPMLGAGVLVILFAQIAAVRLQLFHHAWMTGALALGWVMTRLILTAVFVLVVTPLGLLQRLFKKRALDLAFRTGASSYWETRAESRPSRADYEKQF